MEERRFAGGLRGVFLRRYAVRGRLIRTAVGSAAAWHFEHVAAFALSARGVVPGATQTDSGGKRVARPLTQKERITCLCLAG
eukprot:7336680-Lingulodinium_polyedra.AAC.1